MDGLDVDAYWAVTLGDAVPGVESLAREVHVLDEEELAAKLAAICAYRRQLPALLALNGRLHDLSTLRYEATWRRIGSPSFTDGRR